MAFDHTKFKEKYLELEKAILHSQSFMLLQISDENMRQLKLVSKLIKERQQLDLNRIKEVQRTLAHLRRSLIMTSNTKSREVVRKFQSKLQDLVFDLHAFTQPGLLWRMRSLFF